MQLAWLSFKKCISTFINYKDHEIKVLDDKKLNNIIHSEKFVRDVDYSFNASMMQMISSHIWNG